jgi:hypothetical protein
MTIRPPDWRAGAASEPSRPVGEAMGCNQHRQVE